MNPETCPVSLHAPECMPYPLNEHEARVVLIIWCITLGAALGFMLAKIDWKMVQQLAIGTWHLAKNRFNHKGHEETQGHGEKQEQL